MEDAINFGIEAIKHRVSQTFLNFFDVYSIIDYQAQKDKEKDKAANPLPPAKEDTFVLTIEA